jgi:ParB family transcriptional regulator, chromosome partitioning protein
MKHALGRGLASLIPDASMSKASGPEPIFEVPIEKVMPNPWQPRKEFDGDRQKELVNSIREKGLLQPILVRPIRSGYEIIAGERRFRATQALGWEKIPVIVKNSMPQESLELALIENIQREDLNAIEEAHAYARLVSEFSITQEDISKAVGKERSSVTNTLRLLSLPEKVQTKILKDQISAGHAKALLTMADATKQLDLAERIVKEGLSVRQTEAIVKEGQPVKAKTLKLGKNSDPHMAALEEDLQRSLGTRVRIHSTGKGGQVRIDYYSGEDLNRILGLLGHNTA